MKLIDAVYPMHQGTNRFQPVSASSFTARTTTLPPAPRPAVAPPPAAAPVAGP